MGWTLAFREHQVSETTRHQNWKDEVAITADGKTVGGINCGKTESSVLCILIMIYINKFIVEYMSMRM